jgi:hypothetical protein
MTKLALLDAAPPIPADTLAFTICDHDDPNQLRAFWVRTGTTTHLEIEGGNLPAGTHLTIRLDQMVPLAALLHESPKFAEMTASR